MELALSESRSGYLPHWDGDHRGRNRSSQRHAGHRAASDGRGARDGITAELVDQNEKITVAAPLMQLQSRGGGCRCCCGGGDGGEDRGPYIFQALLTDVSDGAMLRITRRSDAEEQPRDVWTRRAPKNPPRITHSKFTSAKPLVTHDGKSRTFAVRRWNARSSFPKTAANHGTASPSHSPARSITLISPLFRVTKSSSRSLCTMAFSLKASPLRSVPRASTGRRHHHPHDGDTLFAGHPLRLWASVMTGSSRLIEDRACRWMLDGHEVAHGLEAWIVTPDEGEHRCTVLVEDEVSAPKPQFRSPSKADSFANRKTKPAAEPFLCQALDLLRILIFSWSFSSASRSFFLSRR